MDWTYFLQQLINGISIGAFYALIALGYTMVYGVLRFINFAHGDVFMIGAFAGYWLTPKIMPMLGAGTMTKDDEGNLVYAINADAGTWRLVAGVCVVMLLSMAACALLGIIIEKLAYRPLRSRPKLTVLITAIGVSLLLEYGGQYLFGAAPRSFPDLITNGALEHTGKLTILYSDVIAVAATVALLLGLTFIVKFTRLGLAMRALSNNPTAATLMGVNLDTVITFTFGLGSALAGAAGILWSISNPSIDPLMGVQPGVKAFVAAVLGGIGNIPGAAVGGLLIGIIESFVKGSRFSNYTDAIAFAVLIVILLVRPAGLLGKSQVEKV